MKGLYSKFSLCFIVGLINPLLHLSDGQSHVILSWSNSKTWNVNLRDKELHCYAYPKTGVTIRWIKDGVEVLPDEHIQIIAGVEKNGYFGALKFLHLKHSDQGSYQCAAFNNVGLQSQRQMLINISDQAVVSPSSISVKWHDPFMLRCYDTHFHGTSTYVLWTYKAFVNDNDRLTVAFIGVKKIVRWNPFLRSLPRESDAMQLGVVQYEVFCTVHNQYRSHRSKTRTIYIVRPPQAPVVDHVSTLENGKEIKLFWKIVSRPSEVQTCIATFDGTDVIKELLRPYDPFLNELIIGELVPNSLYSVQILCINSDGEKASSQGYYFITTPWIVTVEALNTTSLSVSWNGDLSDPFCDVLIGYRIKLRESHGADSTREVAIEKNTSVFHQLIPGGSYGASVYGYSSSKNCSESTTKYVTLPLFDNILKPIIAVSDVSEKQAVFTIQDVNIKDGAFHNCSLFLCDGIQNVSVDIELTRNVANRTYELKANTEYTVEVGCYTYDMKMLKHSDKKKFRTEEGVPSLFPKIIYLKNSNHSVLVKWSPVTTELNGNFSAYNVCMTSAVKTNRDDGVCFKSVKTSHTFTDVQPATIYKVLVSACTKAGCGPVTFDFIASDRWSILPTRESNIIATSKHAMPPVSGQSNITYILIALGLFSVGIVIIGIACWRCSKKRKNSNEASVIVTPSTCEQTYEVPLLHPTWTESAYSHILSQETYSNLVDVEYGCDHVNLKEVIGNGEFGRVYKAEFSPSKRIDETTNSEVAEVAVKTMVMEVFKRSEYEEFVREGLRMKNMNHPNVMRLLGICLPTEFNNSPNSSQSNVKLSGLDALSPWILVPYMPNGDLKQYLYKARQNEKKIELKQILQFAHDIACGMEYLAEKNIIHRDLACRNCMLDANMKVVVSDFGLSRQVYSSSYYVQRHSTKMPVKWLAIESLMDRKYTSMTDVWSFGVTAWELFTLCETPFPGVGNHEMLGLLKAGTRLNKPDFCPSNVWNDAIYPCWDSRCDERPTFSELVGMFTAFISFYSDIAAKSSQDYSYVNVKPH